MSFDQPIPDPTAVHDPTELQPLQQPDEFRGFYENLPTDFVPADPMGIDFSQVQPPTVQQDAIYDIEIPDSMQLENTPPALSEPQLDLTTASELQPLLKCRVDLLAGYELRGLRETNLYPNVKITDPNILPVPEVGSDNNNKGLALSRLQHVDENWSGDYGGWGSELQPQESQRSLRPTYRIVTPPILPSRGRGFNPNRVSRWRVPRRVPQFHHEYREDIACHRCGEHMIFLGTCRNINCGIDVSCPSCQDTTDSEGRCQNPGCSYYRHKPDDPKCHDCGVFVSEGENWCSECQTRYPDSRRE